MRYAVSLCAFIALTALCVWPADADQFQCTNAKSGHTVAVSGLSMALNRYVQCVNGSAGRDDCGPQFNSLRRAHTDFEIAVSDIGTYCR